MALIQVVVILVIIGLLLWLLFRFVPMDADIKTVIKIVVILAVVLWLLQIFGVWAALGTIRVGR